MANQLPVGVLRIASLGACVVAHVWLYMAFLGTTIGTMLLLWVGIIVAIGFSALCIKGMFALTESEPKPAKEAEPKFHGRPALHH